MKINRLKLIESLESKNKALETAYAEQLTEVEQADEKYQKALTEASKEVFAALKSAKVKSFSTSEDYSYEDGERVIKGTKVWLSVEGKIDLSEPNRNAFGRLIAPKPEDVNSFWVNGSKTSKYEQRQQVIESLKLSDDESVALTVSIKGLL
jgi:hypothetical protein